MLRMMSWQANTLKIAALWAVSRARLRAGGGSRGGHRGTAAPGTGGACRPRRPNVIGGSARLWATGKRSNPLIQSEDIPVLIDLDIAWFGKRWFFDNGDVGLMLFDSAQSTTSLVARYNSDRVFFSKTNTRNT